MAQKRMGREQQIVTSGTARFQSFKEGFPYFFVSLYISFFLYSQNEPNDP
jgi:hypothetical protein